LLPQRATLPCSPRTVSDKGGRPWKTGGHTFEAFFRFLIQNHDTGEPIGTDNVRLFVTLQDGALSGTFQSQIKDTTDTVLLTVTGDYSATPIGV
jgi:hypothetical protein